MADENRSPVSESICDGHRARELLNFKVNDADACNLVHKLFMQVSVRMAAAVMLGQALW